MFAHTTGDLYFLDGTSGIFGYSNIRRMDMRAASGRGKFGRGIWMRMWTGFIYH